MINSFEVINENYQDTMDDEILADDISLNGRGPNIHFLYVGKKIKYQYQICRVLHINIIFSYKH